MSKKDIKVRRLTLALALWLALSALVPSAAAWGISPDANLASYEASYGAEAANYKRIVYGASSADVQRLKAALTELGFFTNQVNRNYYRTLEIAARVFCQQLHLGGDGRVITPLMQAMLADVPNMPQAIAPAVDIYQYSEEKDGSQYTAYTYARLMRNNTIEQVRVGFTGTVQQIASQGEAQALVLQMENDAEKLVYVLHQPLPRTTRFQVGDKVTVLGMTQGLQSLSHSGMSAQRLLVQADRVGYAP